MVAVWRVVPATGGVKLGLVPELERLDRPAPDRTEQCLRFGRSHRLAVRLEVDGKDQMGTDRLRERA